MRLLMPAITHAAEADAAAITPHFHDAAATDTMRRHILMFSLIVRLYDIVCVMPLPPYCRYCCCCFIIDYILFFISLFCRHIHITPRLHIFRDIV